MERPGRGNELDVMRKSKEAGRSEWKVVEEKYQKIIGFWPPLSRFHETLQLRISVVVVVFF